MRGQKREDEFVGSNTFHYTILEADAKGVVLTGALFSSAATGKINLFQCGIDSS